MDESYKDGVRLLKKADLAKAMIREDDVSQLIVATIKGIAKTCQMAYSRAGPGAALDVSAYKIIFV